MQKLRLKHVEFFITNICNLNCEGCDALSNYNLHGNHGEWANWKSIYEPWAEILDIDEIQLIGGEPLAHADCGAWARGLRELWPKSIIMIRTNGTLFGSKNKHIRQLYDICKDYNIKLEIGLHNKNLAPKYLKEIHEWLQPPLKITLSDLSSNYKVQQLERLKADYKLIKEDHWPKCESLEDWRLLNKHYRDECENIHGFTFEEINLEAFDINFNQYIIDANGVITDFKTEILFQQGVMQADANTQQFMLNNSDPVAAHKICHMKSCHQFFEGKLYKCSLVHTLKKFDQQFYVNLTDQDWQIINGYKPAQSDWSYDLLAEFIKDLSNPIAPCKFCPEQMVTTEIKATSKKTVYMKKQKTNKSKK